MTIRELLVQIGFAINKSSTDKAEKEIDDVKKKLDSAGKSGEKAGNEAAKGIERIIPAADKAEKEIDDVKNKLESAGKSGEKAGKEAAEGIERIIPAADKAESELKDIAAAAVIAGSGVDKAMDKAADKVKKVGTEAAKAKEKINGMGAPSGAAPGKSDKSTKKTGMGAPSGATPGKSDKLTKKMGMADTGDALSDAGGKMMMAGGIMAAPIVGTVVVAANFEESMSNVKAITGAVDADFQALEQKAIDLGGSTKYSAGEVAAAMLELGRAGWTTKQILGGIGGVLDAAAAGNVDLARASEIVSATINSMGLEVSKSGHVADVLAMTANKTATGIMEMGETFKYCAPLAKQLDFSLENLGAASGLMANMGIKGGEAGTALRAGLARLVDPTKDATALLSGFGIALSDFSGSNKMADFIGALKGAMAGLSKEERVAAASTIFGQEAMSGWLAVIDQGPEKVAELTNALQNSDGEAARQAKIMQDNLKGAIEQVGGAIDSLGIAIGKPFLVPLTELGLGLADFIGKITTWAQENPGLVKTILTVVGVVGSLLTVFGTVAVAMGSIIGFIVAMQAAWVAIPAAGAALGAAIGPILAVVAAIAAIGYALYDVYQWMNGGESYIGQLLGPWEEFKEAALNALQPIIKIGTMLWQKLVEGAQALWPTIQQTMTIFKQFWDAVSPMLMAIAKIIAGIMFGAIRSLIGVIMILWEIGAPIFLAVFNLILSLINLVMSFYMLIVTGVSKALKLFVDTFGGAINAVKNFFTGLLEFALDILSRIGGAIGDFVSSKIKWAADKLSSLTSFITMAVEGVADNSSRSYSDSRSYNISLRDVKEVKPALAATGGEYFDSAYMTW